jgi:hypothetical protein
LGILRDILLQRFGTNFKVTENPITGTITTTPTLILHNNPDRLGWIIINQGTNDAYLGFKASITAGTGIPLKAGGGQVIIFYEEDLILPEYEVWGISETGNTTVWVLEIVATGA